MSDVEQLTRNAVALLMDTGALFTSGDVSNFVKQCLPNARHGEVSPIVRNEVNKRMAIDTVYEGYDRTTLSAPGGFDVFLYFPEHMDSDEALDVYELPDLLVPSDANPGLAGIFGGPGNATGPSTMSIANVKTPQSPKASEIAVLSDGNRCRFTRKQLARMQGKTIVGGKLSNSRLEIFYR